MTFNTLVKMVTESPFNGRWRLVDGERKIQIYVVNEPRTAGLYLNLAPAELVEAIVMGDLVPTSAGQAGSWGYQEVSSNRVQISNEQAAHYLANLWYILHTAWYRIPLNSYISGPGGTEPVYVPEEFRTTEWNKILRFEWDELPQTFWSGEPVAPPDLAMSHYQVSKDTNVAVEKILATLKEG
jgi:hypothetical protein